MVDDVAWGVGWGGEGSPSSPEDEILVHRSAPRSLSRRRIESSSSRAGSLDAARGRVTSRTRRSRSRASLVSDRSSTSRSVSRNSHLNSALTDSMISTHTVSSISSLSYDESALVMSPPLRGRKTRDVHPQPASRSPSPPPREGGLLSQLSQRLRPPSYLSINGAQSLRG